MYFLKKMECAHSLVDWFELTLRSPLTGFSCYKGTNSLVMLLVFPLWPWDFYTLWERCKHKRLEILLSLWYLLTFLCLSQSLDLCPLDSSGFEHSFLKNPSGFSIFISQNFSWAFTFLKHFLNANAILFYQSCTSLLKTWIHWRAVLSRTDLNLIRDPITSLLDVMCSPWIFEMIPHSSICRKKATYHSVGKVMEVLNQHLLNHVWLGDNNKHPATKIVPGGIKKITLKCIVSIYPFLLSKKNSPCLEWRIKDK